MPTSGTYGRKLVGTIIPTGSHERDQRGAASAGASSHQPDRALTARLPGPASPPGSRITSSGLHATSVRAPRASGARRAGRGHLQLAPVRELDDVVVRLPREGVEDDGRRELVGAPEPRASGGLEADALLADHRVHRLARATRPGRGPATIESAPPSSATTVRPRPLSATVPARKFARPRNRATKAVAGRR